MTDTLPPGFPDAAGEAAWRTAVAKVLKGADPESLVQRTDDGISVSPLYPPAAAPGPAGGRPRLAIMARLDHVGSRAADELGSGADGLVLTVSGAPAARGFGLDIAGLDTALDDVALDRTPLRLEPDPSAPFDALRAMLDLAAARRCDPQALALDAGLDPLGDFAGAGTPQGHAALPAFGAAVATSRRGGFTFRMMRADGRPHHDAGATEAQELAAVVASAIAYLGAIAGAGVALEEARRALSFTLAADAEEFVTIAKCRALRQLWARVEESCGLAAEPIRLHAETSYRMMTRRDPHTNLLRGTLAAAGAVLGGADSLTVLPFTAPLGLADPLARRLARNTALILRDEAGLDRVADPGAGSGAIEALTEGLCVKAWELVQEIEGGGGMTAALATGAWAQRLAVSRERRRAAIRDGRRVLVGTTAFVTAAETPVVVVLPRPAAPPHGAGPSLRDDELVDSDGAPS